ncbi:MAG: ACP S-malonyltransferase, partial [Gemmatimonadales bacterium]
MVTVLLFPGQGTQQVGMTKDLAAGFPIARAELARIDVALQVPLSRLMWDGPLDQLTLTQNAQPAILAHSAAVLAVVRRRLGRVVAAAGHSLGEYSAWVAAGALDAAVAATLVRRRGELMFQASQTRTGAMAAVIGLGTTDVEVACAQAEIDTEATVVAANLNAPDQTVISGDPAAVSRGGELCLLAGAKRVLPLNVSGAFHSPLMASAGAGLRDAINATVFAPPAFPVVANATADFVESGVEAAALLAAQLTAPVRWVESMRRLADRHPDARWLELGPGGVLTGLLKRIVPGARCTALGTAAQV